MSCLNTATCDRCSAKCNEKDLRRVAWWLQLLAFPITFVFVLSSLLSLNSMIAFAKKLRGGKLRLSEYRHRYCPECIGRQQRAHWIVAIWAVSFGAYLIYEALA